MIKNFITIAIRNLIRQRGFSVINILGLTIGLTISALILLYIIHELGYDRFHENAKHIYRVAIKGDISGQILDVAVTSPPFGPALYNDFPEVIEYTRLDYRSQNILFSIDDLKYYEDDVIFADSAFLKIFTVPLRLGDPETALQAPRSVLLSETLAQKYFGNENPIGKTIRFNNQEYLAVTGVFEDYPENSHMHFNILISYSTMAEMLGQKWLDEWGSLSQYTYILVNERADIDQLQLGMLSFLEKYMGEDIQESSIQLDPYLQPLTKIHLHSDLMAELGDNSDIVYIYILAAITLFILLLASINFMNLSTARSANRAREVGIRKVCGSGRKELVIQFLGESVVISLIALFISFFLIELILPVFNQLTGKDLDMNYLLNWQLTLGFILLAFVVGIIAGSYPALFLSAFNPVKVLQSHLKSGSSNITLRFILVIFQYTVSIALIIGTVVIYNQLSFINRRPLGFDKENVIIIALRNREVSEKGEVIKQEMMKIPNLISVSLSDGFPGGTLSGTGYFPEGFGDTDPWLIFGFDTDPDFIESTMKMEIINGRNFSAELLTDSTAILINETLLAKLGWEDPIGKIIKSGNENNPVDYRIIGVIKDFHDQSLHLKINPILIGFLTDRPDYLVARIAAAHIDSTLIAIENTWDEINPEIPFDYFFLDDNFESYYQFEQKLGKIFIYFTLFALFIASLGLFGLASFTAEQRTKEIGIRKAMGSSINQISLILSIDFIKPVLLANVFAWPIAWYLMRKWLQNFEYKTSIDWWIFLAAGILAIIIALVTVYFQTIKTASTNPVQALRYE